MHALRSDLLVERAHLPLEKMGTDPDARGCGVPGTSDRLVGDIVRGGLGSGIGVSEVEWRCGVR